MTPLQWKLRVTPPQWKLILDPHGGNMYKQNQQRQGEIIMQECDECCGEGVCEHERWEKYDTYEPYSEYKACQNCNGTGQVESDHD